MAAPRIPLREWRTSNAGREYLISTEVRLIDRSFVNEAFSSPDMYWATATTPEMIEIMLANATTLGLYEVSPTAPPAKTGDSPSSPRTPSPTLEGHPKEHLRQIGMARIITDHVTTAYLTDVYVLPDYRSSGLGKWIIKCCDEIFQSMAAPRRTILFTGSDVARRFYARELGMQDVADEKGLICMTKRFFDLDH